MFDSVSYGEKISELLSKDQSKDRPFFIYFAPLTKVYPNQRNSFEEIVNKRREKISQLDQAVDLVRRFVRSKGVIWPVCPPDHEDSGENWSVRQHGGYLHVRQWREVYQERLGLWQSELSTARLQKHNLWGRNQGPGLHIQSSPEPNKYKVG